MGIGEEGGLIVEGAARELAAEDHQWLVLPRRELFLGREISGSGRPGIPDGSYAAGLPFSFPRRRFFALFHRALPAPGHFHLRRAGIGAVAVTPDRIPKTV